MMREREADSAGKRKPKNQAMFELQLNKCNNIAEKDKLMIKAHLVEGRNDIIEIFHHFSAYKCYKRLETQLKKYLMSFKGKETAERHKNVKEVDFQSKSPKTFHFKDHSQKQTEQLIFPRKHSLALDVGLLKQASELRYALSPQSSSNLKVKKSNKENKPLAQTARTYQKQQKLKKVYSISKFSSEDNRAKQNCIRPFCQNQINPPNFMKMFLMNKLKHQKQLQKIKKDIDHQNQVLIHAFNDKNDESIFSFEIYTKNPEKEQNFNEASFGARQQVDGKHQQTIGGGTFYKRIRKIIDNQQP